MNKPISNSHGNKLFTPTDTHEYLRQEVREFCEQNNVNEQAEVFDKKEQRSFLQPNY